jgi:predicted unusual protein kinase regulating ubiquinone biosynthesis (AarF/ABC1/UbiB family)
MVEVFAQQIFVSGIVHADPHPGTLIVQESFCWKVLIDPKGIFW